MPATSARLLQSVQLALLFLVNIAQPSPVTHPTVGLVKRAVRDGFTPHNPPLGWVALGDSYTAGPGAGDSFDGHHYCFRSRGAYPVQLTDDFPFDTQNRYQFLACTGAKTGDVVHSQLPNVHTNPHPDFVVMTLGGNDIGFGKIVRACLVKLAGGLSDDCEQTIRDSDRKMNSHDFQDDMFRAYDGIFARMPADYHYQLYHILYSKFFNDQTQWCDGQTFGIWPGYQPPLTRDLRQRLNIMTENFNGRLQDIAQRYLESKWPPDRPHAPGWAYNRLFTVNPDYYGLFDGHRFCELNVQDPSFRDPSIWFFGVNTQDASRGKVRASHFSNINAQSCQKDPKYEGNLTFSYSCDYARYLASPGAPKDHPVPLQDWILSAFHPRTVGHSAVKRLFSNILIQNRPNEVDLCGSPPSRQEVVISRGVKVTNGRETSPPKPQCIAQKPTSSSKGPPPPYETGTCHVHVKEIQDCSDDSKNLYAIVSMEDNGRHDIGHTVVDASKNPFGNPINAGKPYAFESKLHDSLVITGEHQNDYVQFALGSMNWDSKTSSGSPYCKTGPWNPKDGPNCIGEASQPATRDMECFFPC